MDTSLPRLAEGELIFRVHPVRERLFSNELVAAIGQAADGAERDTMTHVSTVFCHGRLTYLIQWCSLSWFIVGALFLNGKLCHAQSPTNVFIFNFRGVGETELTWYVGR